VKVAPSRMGLALNVRGTDAQLSISDYNGKQVDAYIEVAGVNEEDVWIGPSFSVAGPGDYGIEAVAPGCSDLSATIGFLQRENDYWFIAAVAVILAATYIVASLWRRQAPEADQMEKAIVIALILGILITLAWVSVVRKGKEPFSVLYLDENSYSNHLNGSRAYFAYVVECREYNPTDYELDVMLGQKVLWTDRFRLCQGDIPAVKLQRSDYVEIPKDAILPVKVGLVLRDVSNGKSYDVHFFLRDRTNDTSVQEVNRCANGEQDDDETGIDCGGSCGPCPEGSDCGYDNDCLSGWCAAGKCALPTCFDTVRNQNEEEADCGGVCIPCHCKNRVIDQNETDVDCGGPCPRCPKLGKCSSDKDCLGGWCRNGTCMKASCFDGAQNQNEAGIDCGGPCRFCPDDGRCSSDKDCLKGWCRNGTCVNASCSDGLRNQDETDVDCGGSCTGCDTGKGCLLDPDCLSRWCAGGLCEIPTCFDGVQNQDETDVDCGGGCPLCGQGGRCVKDDDCVSAWCYKGNCTVQTCFDRVKNQNETRIDCGGPCPECPPACWIDADCGNLTIGKPYCYNNATVKDYITYTCQSPGEKNATCTNVTETRVYERCMNGSICRAGACVARNDTQ